MKKWMFLCTAAALLFAACNNEKKEKDEKENAEATAKKMVALPLPAAYSSSFEMSDQAYAATIVQGSWKDWQDNKLDNMKSWMADTVVAYHSNGKMVKGVDSMMATWKRDRSTYSSVIDTVHAAFAVRSTDKNQNWVLVWASEIDTKLDGKIDTIEMMETWRMNKDGKADLLLQYDRHARK